MFFLNIGEEALVMDVEHGRLYTCHAHYSWLCTLGKEGI